MERVLRWAGTAEAGLEHLVLRTGDGIRAEAVVIGGPAEAPFGLRYTIICDPGWSLRAVSVALAGEEWELRLLSDGRGNWADGSGRSLPLLAGCLDLDLAATPFTNTLPIRRLGLRAGESRDLRVVYLPVPELQPLVVTQRYTCLAEGRRYQFEGLGTGFSAELEVDPDGLVVDYPGLFHRVF